MRSRRQFLASAATLAGGLLAGGALGAFGGRFRRPNVLLVCIDALRADRMGYAGCRRPLTPSIDSLAARGVAFTDALASSSWTKTAVASLLSGTHPFVHSVLDQGHALPGDVPTMQSILSAAGYLTYACQTNPWLGNPRFGFDRFDVFQFLSHNESLGHRIRIRGTSRGAYADGSAVVDRADKFFAQLAGTAETFFGYVHLMDVHEPYEPPAPYNAMFSPPGSAGMDDAALGPAAIGGAPVPTGDVPAGHRARAIDLYDGGVRYADEIVRRLVAALEARGLASNTIIIVCSDHGEELWEHGSRGHGLTLYDEVLRIPLVMAGPGLPAGVVIEERARQVDVLPTVLDLVGVRVPGALDGRSLLPAIRGAAFDPRQVANIAFLRLQGVTPMRSMAAVAPRLKLIVSEPPGGTRRELYNLRADPGEKADLAASSGELTASLSSEFDRIVDAASRKAFVARNVEISPETRRQLKALGYLQ